jgi:hypothetical protein
VLSFPEPGVCSARVLLAVGVPSNSLVRALGDLGGLGGSHSGVRLAPSLGDLGGLGGSHSGVRLAPSLGDLGGLGGSHLRRS